IPETLTPKQKLPKLLKQKPITKEEPQTQAITPTTRSMTVKYPPDSEEQQAREKAIALWIGRTGLPVWTVEDKDFVNMMATADGRLTVPTKSQINDLLETFYCSEKQKFKERLAKARRITICLDSRTNKGLTASFLAISACYFCTELNKAQHILLNLEPMTGPHTTQFIKMHMDRCTKAWGIPQDKIITVITDNGSNMVAAFQHIEEEEEPSTEEEDSDIEGESDEEGQRYGSMARTPCVMRTLQLVVDTAHQEVCVAWLLEKMRTLAKHLRKSSVATERLFELCGLSVIKDCPTRWPDTYLMISHLLQMKDAIVQVADEMRWDCLLPAEWNKLSALRELLLPFAEHTKILQSDAMCLSLVVPALLDLNAHLSSFIFNSAHRDLSILAEKLKADLQNSFRYFLDARDPRFLPLSAAACLLDPTISDTLVKSSDEQIQELLSKAEEHIIKMSATRPDEMDRDEEEEPREDVEPASKRPRFKFLSQLVARQVMSRSSEFRVKQELRRYKEMLSHAINEDSGVDFWLAQSSDVYHILKPLALDLLAMPASQSFTERAFSVTGDLSRAHRNRARLVLEQSAFLKLNQEN
ncbi:hypothetical protein LDENG_00182180, partial [Lucifuga dentata]